ncbi:MAG TPA: serine/threonine-protein kinase [Chloroflexota bacterium]|nr:serine/threonine-protein kinase [Chloroflexota bacterium]
MAVSGSPDLGKVLEGRYRLHSLLGQGGTGAVYLAEDTQLFGRPVAVKELIEQFAGDEEREAAVQRFAQEARMLVTLSHPNLPDVRSHFAEDGRHYLVMEYVEGSTLARLLEQANGTLQPAVVLDWGRQICDVLTYLHGRTPPVIFRDLKPTNIMLDRHGRIKLIDFGTARHFDHTKNTDTLKMGSIGYAPPEQYQGYGQTSPQTDIYALGATLHHLLTNQDPSAHPFVFTPPSMIRPEIPEPLSRAIMRSLNLDPAHRFASVTDFRHALDGPATVEAPTTALRVVRPAPAPNPWLVGLFGAIGAAVLEGAALLPEISHLGEGTASADWAVDYGVLVGAALGAALGGALAPGYLRHRVTGTLLALLGSGICVAAVGVGIILAQGHGDPKQFSLRLLVAMALPAAVIGAGFVRALGAGA